jgi:DNA-binding NarL/FixJ family response regulator
LAVRKRTRAGAGGFLPTSRASAEVVAAVRKAAEGEMLIPAAQLAGLLPRVHQLEAVAAAARATIGSSPVALNQAVLDGVAGRRAT